MSTRLCHATITARQPLGWRMRAIATMLSGSIERSFFSASHLTIEGLIDRGETCRGD
jgi:hypothetical protein